MSVGSVLIGLQASRKDGGIVTSDDFLLPLDITHGEVEATRADGSQWQAGMVYFSVIRQSDFDGVDTSIDPGAPTEAFFAAIIEAFRNAGRFFQRRSREVTDRIRAAGLSIRIFIDVRMDQDQMELEFPPEFLAACGRHGLSVYLISNDIPAAEILASRSSE